MKVTIETPEPVERTVTIEMTEDEAQSLLIICTHIGGRSETSRRRHFDHLAKQLRSVGIFKPAYTGTGDQDIIFFESQEK